ncbi:MAG: PaaI family thioesterase [Kangiellaceae bacterium]|nr:PaaI family thioesterase [Kangiellaceae bacterium]
MNPLIKLHSSEEIIKNADNILTSTGYHKILGFRHISWEEKRVELILKIKPHHLNLGGVIHGGVLSALLDVACAEAGTFCPYEGRLRKAITLSLSTTFTGQCSHGEIRIIGNLRASGRRIYNSSGEVFDEQGKLLAIADGTFRLRSGSDKKEGVESNASSVTHQSQ